MGIVCSALPSSLPIIPYSSQHSFLSRCLSALPPHFSHNARYFPFSCNYLSLTFFPISRVSKKESIKYSIQLIPWFSDFSLCGGCFSEVGNSDFLIIQ